MNIPLSALYDTSGVPVEAEVFDVGNTLTISASQLEESPSRKEGISKGLEEKVRLRSCEIVCGVLTLCGVDRTVICTAQVYLHRYYCQRSVASFDYKYVALGVIYLALKTEETNITEDELIPVYCRFLRRAYLSEEKTKIELNWVLHRSSEYDLWWDWLVCIELDILIAFGFKLHTPRPHKLMFAYMQKLGLTQFLQEVWTALNDSYSTTLCVLFRAEDLACGAIFYTAKKHRVGLPDVGQHPWWILFGATEDALYDFALQISDLYARPEADFDFTQELDISYRNERADGLKKPHPALLRPVLDSPESNDKDPREGERCPVKQKFEEQKRSSEEHRQSSGRNRGESRRDDRSRSDRDRRRRHHRRRSSREERDRHRRRSPRDRNRTHRR